MTLDRRTFIGLLPVICLPTPEPAEVPVAATDVLPILVSYWHPTIIVSTITFADGVWSIKEGSPIRGEPSGVTTRDANQSRAF